MNPQSGSPPFEQIALAQLDAAYNLAHWLLRDRAAAEDVVQDAMLRALTYFHTFRGVNARAWVLQIVRNVAYEHLRKARGHNLVSIDSEAGEMMMADTEIGSNYDNGPDNPERSLLRERERGELTAALQRLPVDLRECIVLRELEDLSYREIAQVTGAPVGTVMSRLWRARQALLKVLTAEGS